MIKTHLILPFGRHLKVFSRLNLLDDEKYEYDVFAVVFLMFVVVVVGSEK